MIKLGLLVTMIAKLGKENELSEFLHSALTMANKEQETPVWFAVRKDYRTFAIFDAFASESARQSHLQGAIAAALMSKAEDLLSQAPLIEEIDVLAAKI